MRNVTSHVESPVDFYLSAGELHNSNAHTNCHAHAAGCTDKHSGDDRRACGNAYQPIGSSTPGGHVSRAAHGHPV
jgi:hypothetical protein